MAGKKKLKKAKKLSATKTLGGGGFHRRTV